MPSDGIDTVFMVADSGHPYFCRSEYSQNDLTLIRLSRRAMATQFEIAIPAGEREALSAAEDALDLIDSIEEKLTVYRPTSTISQLNEQASRAPVSVDHELFALLSECATLSQATAGAFDIATGALIKAWGFYQREGRVPSSAEFSKAMAATGMKHVSLDARHQTVKFHRPNLEFNFGAVGKGYALDRAAELLQRKWGIRSALLSGGGSSIYALGRPPGRLSGWSVAIRHPHEDQKTLGTVALCNQGFGTSAATYQFFEYNGKKYGHVLDPRTGRPGEGMASVSVVAATATQADALSTAFFVAGVEAANNYCRPRPTIGAILLPTGHTQPIVMGAAERLWSRSDVSGHRPVA